MKIQVGRPSQCVSILVPDVSSNLSDWYGSYRVLGVYRSLEEIGRAFRGLEEPWGRKKAAFGPWINPEMLLPQTCTNLIAYITIKKTTTTVVLAVK